MQEQRAHNRQAGLRIQCDGLFQVRFQGSEDGGHTGKMGDSFRVAVKLPVVARTVTFMGAHHRREGAEIAPAQQQLFAALHLKQGGVTANITVMQAMSGHCQRQRRRDDRRQSIVQTPVNVLVARPHHGGVFLATGGTGAHKEEDLAELARFFKGFVVTFRPQRRPGVMHNFGADAVMQVSVGGQILAEVSHPAAAAEFNHVLFDHFLEPGVGFRISEIDNAAVELAKLHQIIAAGGIFCQIAALCRFFAEVFIAGNIRVDIGKELYALFVPLLDT